MRLSPRLGLRIVLVVIAVAIICVRLIPRHFVPKKEASPIPDLAATSPLNQPGGAAAPAEAYDIYSALYQEPAGEPLAFAENSVTDIPQVGGSCLKPTTPEEKEMTDAFVAANRESHRWEQKFTIPQGYRLLAPGEVAQARACLEAARGHGKQDAAKCESYKQIRHVRFLGVPGSNQQHTQALVSVIRSCGEFCGNGGIFAVEKSDGTWRRSETTDFTRDCSWTY